MARPLTLVIFSASMMALSLAQTFQYSRGWTNGKRGGHPSQVLGGLPGDFVGSPSGGQQVAGNPILDMPTPCQIQKLKMILRGTVGADQLYLLPCEIIETSGTASMSEFSPIGRFRRSSVPQENNKSY